MYAVERISKPSLQCFNLSIGVSNNHPGSNPKQSVSTTRYHMKLVVECRGSLIAMNWQSAIDFIIGHIRLSFSILTLVLHPRIDILQNKIGGKGYNFNWEWAPVFHHFDASTTTMNRSLFDAIIFSRSNAPPPP
jgi:hypothetical protein